MGLLGRLADLSLRRPRTILVVAGAWTILAAGLGGNVVDRLSGAGFEDPSYESSQVNRELADQLGADADPRIVILARSSHSLRTVSARREIEQLAREIHQIPEVGRVSTPFSATNAAPLSRDGQAGVMLVHLNTTSQDVIADRVTKLRERQDPADVEFLVGGFGAQFEDFELTAQDDLVRIETLGIPLLLILLFIIFRGLVAAALPFAIALVSLLGSFLVISIVHEFTPVATYAVNVTTALGLGLAIDYGLLMVSRYREEIRRAGPGPEALRATMRTAGRTVMFSGVTVAAMTTALLHFPQRLIHSVGVGAMAASLLACIAALTVIPALLVLLGERIKRLSIR